MRLWTVHPKHLDSRGLVALWREGLLAQAVLCGRTRGYRHHPQLDRFKAHARPTAAIAAYLHAVCDEADARGYHFDRSKVARRIRRITISETGGQLQCEWSHLLRKLKRRSPADYRRVFAGRATAHPMFRLRAGGVQPWEKAR